MIDTATPLSNPMQQADSGPLVPFMLANLPFKCIRRGRHCHWGVLVGTAHLRGGQCAMATPLPPLAHGGTSTRHAASWAPTYVGGRASNQAAKN